MIQSGNFLIFKSYGKAHSSKIFFFRLCLHVPSAGIKSIVSVVTLTNTSLARTTVEADQMFVALQVVLIITPVILVIIEQLKR